MLSTTEDRVAKWVTNTRDEKVRSSNFWNRSFEERSYLVPLTLFSEPICKQPVVRRE